MIEEILQNYLSDNLSAPVYLEVPETPPDEFVVIEKTGSGVSDHIYSAMFAFQSYSRTLLEAAELNELVKSAMDCAMELDEISMSHLNSDYNYTDPSAKRYRYQAVYDITHF